MKSIPPVCFFPTTICLVDDHQPFLNSLMLRLNPSWTFTQYNNPIKAIAAIEQNASEHPFFLKKCFSWVLDDEMDRDNNMQALLDLKTHEIHKEALNPNRSAPFSVVVLDYNMPEMNGLVFSEKLKHLPVKKIMLTADAELDLAVKAFNDGTIDRFIRKGSDSLFEDLSEAIHVLQWEYFEEQSQFIHQHLLLHPHYTLKEPAVAQTFQEIYAQGQFVEFYLIDNSGSHLFVDANGNSSWFLVRSAQEMTKHASLAQDQGAPEGIFKAIQNKTHLLFLFDEQDHQKPATQWDRDLYLAQAISQNGEVVAYYALVSGEQSQLPVYFSQAKFADAMMA